MTDLIALRESAASPDNTPVFEQFSPLCERAVRNDGTIGIKIIQPGWGSSGYYPRNVLERDVPRIFPAGTHMFWNHPTYSEEAERPEGDLSALAAVTVSTPIWLENGPKGPGMYADARPFSGYAETIDEIGEHIGVSIRAMGRHSLGEAEGKQGRIIDELVAGKSIDYVTAAGAGGAIVSIFESAPGNGRLPDPANKKGIETFLAEAGRVLSKANEMKLKAALEQLTAVLSLLGDDEGATEAAFRASRLHEALSNNDIRQVLDDKLKSRFGGREIYVWARDWSVRDGWVVFEISTNTNCTVYRLGMVATETDVILAEDPPTEVRAMTMYVPVRVSESLANNTEDAMSEQELNEARAALTARETALQESQANLAKLQEQLLLREAQDYVNGALAGVELPDMTKTRLVRSLVINPPVKEGKIDEAAYKARVETAVTEAQAEIATLLGKTGKVTGNGSAASTGSGNGGEEPTIEGARTRLNESLASMGYGSVNGGSNGN